MFKYWTSILIIFISFYSSIGQNKEFNAGVKISGNALDIRGRSTSFWRGTQNETWGGLGYSGGIFCERFIAPKFFAALHIQYIRKGSTYQFINTNNESQMEKFRIQYIEVPFMIGYRLKPKEGKGYCLFQLGAAYAKALSSKYTFEELAENTQKDEMYNFKNTDISVIGSVKVPLNETGKNNFYLGVNASWSILSIHKYYDLRNLCFGLDLSYLFFTNKK